MKDYSGHYMYLLKTDGGKKLYKAILGNANSLMIHNEDLNYIDSNIVNKNDTFDPCVLAVEGANKIFYGEEYANAIDVLRTIYGGFFETEKEFDMLVKYSLSKLLFAFYYKNEIMLSYLQASDEDELLTTKTNGKLAIKPFEEIAYGFGPDEYLMLLFLTGEQSIGTR